MFIWHPTRPRPKSRLRLPPAVLGFLALVVIGLGTLSQVRDARAQATAPAAAPVAAPATGPAATENATGFVLLWDLFVKGGYVMWVLAACSVLALAIVFERLYSLRRNQVLPPGFLPGLRSVYRDPSTDRERAIAYCRANDSPLARMVAAFFKRLPRGVAAAEKAVEDAGGNEALRLRANLRVFYALGSAATLLGLIGTIAGMIRAFMATAKAGETANKVELLSTGIYEAMVCTFGGLAVAILVTIFYYYFVGRVEKLITEINDELSAFADEYGLQPESEDELAVTGSLPRL